MTRREWVMLMFGMPAVVTLLLLGLNVRRTVALPVGLACYVTVHPTSNDRDTVWVCYRVRS